jgi:enoyl-CoA hydratase/carnithine racemase
MNAKEHASLKVSTEADGQILIVELDHGRANEMGSAELTDWERLCDTLEQGNARALITFSQRRSRKGTPIFIAGANVTERTDWSDEQVRAHVRRQRSVLARLRRVPVFHLVLVDGVALGWGTEFLITADYRLATPNARFGLPETSLGILPGAGGTSELWSLIGVPQALRLGMSGEQIGSAEALNIGLVQEEVADLDQGLERARTLAHQVSKRSPTAVAAFKRGVLASVGIPATERVEIEAQAYEHCVSTGEAAIGRVSFKKILSGESVRWGPRVIFEP